MPSPHPLPLNIARMTGADAKNPQRYRARKNAPQPAAGIGEPPAHLSGGAVEVWLEILPTMVDGVLTVADRLAWCALCELEAERRESPREFTAARYATLVSLLSRFGMTPADRAKIQVNNGEEKQQNPFAEFGNA